MSDQTPCACGCGELIESRDRFGRPRRFQNGHNGRKYADPTQYKREWNHRHREQRAEYKGAYHRKRKAKLLIRFGGACIKCRVSYDGTNAAMFHFHHHESNKEFNVGNQITNKAWATIMTEASKCQLLCANCHELEHSEAF